MGRNFDFTLNFEGKMTLSKIAKHGGEDGGAVGKNGTKEKNAIGLAQEILNIGRDEDDLS